jgi:molybdopterin/thiamine biosynthesis adenylyltransferase
MDQATKGIEQMQTQYINEMLDIPELQIHQILPIPADEIHKEILRQENELLVVEPGRRNPGLIDPKFDFIKKHYMTIQKLNNLKRV